MAQDLHSVEELRELYREPPAKSMAKLDAIDKHCRALIAHSSLVFLATADADGNCDCSPKGGPPGFVAVLDDKHLAIADLSGNNKIDNMRNLVTSNGIGLCFVIPGVTEVLRVNGRARITQDRAVAEAAAIDGIVPRVSLVVEVEEAYVHCGKALRRSGVWEAEKWPDISDLPSYGTILKDHKEVAEMTAEQLDVTLNEFYGPEWLWKAGGDDPEGDFHTSGPPSYEVDVDRPVDEVFAFLGHYENELRWHPLVGAAVLSSGTPGELGVRYTGKLSFMGTQVDTEVEITALEPNRRIVYNVVAGTAEFTETYEVAPRGMSTHVALSMEAGDLTPVLATMLGPTLTDGVNKLKTVLEGGS